MNHLKYDINKNCRIFLSNISRQRVAIFMIINNWKISCSYNNVRNRQIIIILIAIIAKSEQPLPIFSRYITPILIFFAIRVIQWIKDFHLSSLSSCKVFHLLNYIRFFSILFERIDKKRVPKAIFEQICYLNNTTTTKNIYLWQLTKKKLLNATWK